MTSRLRPGHASARVAGAALVLALGSGLAGPAFAAARPADPAPPTAPPSSPDKNYYCKSDPNWYLCQHHQK